MRWEPEPGQYVYFNVRSEPYIQFITDYTAGLGDAFGRYFKCISMYIYPHISNSFLIKRIYKKKGATIRMLGLNLYARIDIELYLIDPVNKRVSANPYRCYPTFVGFKE